MLSLRDIWISYFWAVKLKEGWVLDISNAWQFSLILQSCDKRVTVLVFLGGKYFFNGFKSTRREQRSSPASIRRVGSRYDCYDIHMIGVFLLWGQVFKIRPVTSHRLLIYATKNPWNNYPLFRGFKKSKAVKDSCVFHVQSLTFIVN